jgi:hypothetical protein
MPNQYPYEVPTLSETPLPDEILIHIAKIIRQFSEFEFVLNLHLCQLTNLMPYQLDALVGATSLSRRITTARKLAALRDEDVFTRLQDDFFKTGFRQVQSIRNTVAHGTYIGTNAEKGVNFYYFLTQSTTTDTKDRLASVVNCLGENAIKNAANYCEANFPLFEKAMELKPFREKLLLEGLQRHRKSHPTR